jgi:molybdenum cofactor cytidylyltransferase
MAVDGEWNFGAVILGAGRSSRMGRPKLLLPWGDTTVLGHLLAQWKNLSAAQIAIVCRPDDGGVHSELDRLEFAVKARIANPEADRGMFSSVQCAARWDGWVEHLSAMALVLGDQPHLSAASLAEILTFARGHADKICQPARRGHGRHPVFLPRNILPELGRSTLGTLKEFLAEHATRVDLLEMADAALDLDIDRPEDYERARKFAP